MLRVFVYALPVIILEAQAGNIFDESKLKEALLKHSCTLDKTTDSSSEESSSQCSDLSIFQLSSSEDPSTECLCGNPVVGECGRCSTWCNPTCGGCCKRDPCAKCGTCGKCMGCANRGCSRCANN
ncbi:hypothetical protein RUM43_004100 [Polyplax serrata]|uniref:Uncharacterized protein n=1 Tax=Polyplax serrata TaxID=468196 RepID=A0AAN8SAJ5_POLSC